MPRPILSALFFVVVFPIRAFAVTDSLPVKYAATDSLPPRYFSLGLKKAGIGLGDAPVYTGFKFNLANNHIRRVNIFDLSVYGESDSGIINGIAVGIAGTALDRNNGIAIGGIISVVKRENGLMAALLAGGEKINGIGIGGMLACDTLNGLGASFFSIVPRRFAERRDSMADVVNGIAISIFGSNVSKFSGVAIGVFNDADQHKGLTIGGFNKSGVHKGLAVGGYNKTARLKGVQVGVYNVAMNNPKGFRRLPLINMHLGK